MGGNDRLYGICLRSYKNGHHIRGSQRLGVYDEIVRVSHEMVKEAVSFDQGELDEINLKVELLDHFNVMMGKFPDFVQLGVGNYREGRRAAQRIAVDAGVSKGAYEQGINLLTKTCGQGGMSLPGAMIVDAFTGERLDGLKTGVWIGRVDLTERIRLEVEKKFRPERRHVQEWLVTAAKVLAMPNLMTELLISNDVTKPDGMISTPGLGAMYFPELRANHNEVGGRILFVRSNGFVLAEAIQYLEKAVLLVDSVGTIR